MDENIFSEHFYAQKSNFKRVVYFSKEIITYINNVHDKNNTCHFDSIIIIILSYWWTVTDDEYEINN